MKKMFAAALALMLFSIGVERAAFAQTVQDKAGAYLKSGIAFFDKKEYDKAAADFSEALAWRGRTYTYINEYDKAAADCKRALELDPKNAAAYFALGRMSDIEKDYDGAIENYTKAIGFNSNYSFV